MELLTPRLRVDALRDDDAEALFACRVDPAVARFQGWCPVDVATARDFIAVQPTPAEASGWFQRAIRLRGRRSSQPADAMRIPLTRSPD